MGDAAAEISEQKNRLWTCSRHRYTYQHQITSNKNFITKTFIYIDKIELLLTHTYPLHRNNIGTNEVGSYLPDHQRNQDDWDSYGIYGGSYGYDTNYVGKFNIPKYYPKSQPKLPHSYENDHFYGEFYNYGGAFGYGDSYIPANQDTLYSGSGKVEECSVRAGAGFRLSRSVVRKTYLTPNLDQCESLCINEKSFICMSFSYR